MKSKKTTNIVGLAVLYWKERGWVKTDAVTMAAPKGQFEGDTIQLEYIEGRSMLYHTKDGEAHHIFYNELPLPQQTIEWLLRINKKRAASARRNNRLRNNTMRKAFKGARKK